MSERINPTQTTRIAILIAFGFVVILLVFSQYGGKEKESSRSELLVSRSAEEGPSLKEGKMAMVGGLGGVREKDDEVQEIVNKVLPEFAQRSGKNYASIEVLSYRTQTVAGRNFFVKGKAKTSDGQEDIVHLRIYRDLSKKLSLTAFQLDKKPEEELMYFQ